MTARSSTNGLGHASPSSAPFAFLARARSSCSTAPAKWYVCAPHGAATALSQPSRDPVVKATRELRDLLDFFNIDASVPVVVMTQDVARTFASSKDDRTMFKLYYECLEFDKTHKALEDARYNVEVAMQDVGKARDQLLVRALPTSSCLRVCHASTRHHAQALEQRRLAAQERMELFTEVDTWAEQLDDLRDFLILRAVRGCGTAGGVTTCGRSRRQPATWRRLTRPRRRPRPSSSTESTRSRSWRQSATSCKRCTPRYRSSCGLCVQLLPYSWQRS